MDGALLAMTMATLGVALASALLPVINIEAYLIALAVSHGSGTAWWFALVATAGQMAGKVLFYYAGQGAMRLPALSSRKAGSRWFDLGAWHSRLAGRPWVSVGVVFASAASGVPPFAIISLLAGMLRVPLMWFLVAGSVGRYARFMVVLMVPGMLGWHFG